ncbi:MAG: alpha/beta hydrolase family protein, partial [Acidimicrobiales bacterium]
DRCPEASPVALLPLGLPQLLVHGLADRTVPPASSERYAERALAAGDPVELLTLRSLDHAAMLDPDRAAWQVAVARIDGWFGGHRPGGRPNGR